ncbi:MAG: hypothetical protein WDZ59_14895 [Pirellulales bacterium]
MKILKRAALLGAMALFVGVVPFTGCEREENVLDVETPDGELEVNRDKDDGSIEVEVDDK